MRIAFDLDGVLADLHTPFVAAALKIFPRSIERRWDPPDVGASPPSGDAEPAADDADAEAPAVPPLMRRPVTRRQADEIWRYLSKQEDLWEGLNEIESGAIARLASIADERRWEVIFVTSRPRSAGRTVQRQSQRWLERQGFPAPERLRRPRIARARRERAGPGCGRGRSARQLSRRRARVESRRRAHLARAAGRRADLGAPPGDRRRANRRELSRHARRGRSVARRRQPARQAPPPVRVAHEIRIAPETLMHRRRGLHVD